MPKLVIYLLVFLQFATLSLKVEAQAITSAEETEHFALAYGCDVGGPVHNETQYLVWISFLQGMVEGLYVADIFQECPESPYRAISRVFAGEVTSDDLVKERGRLLQYIAPRNDVTDIEQVRILQGYGAAEYLAYVYFICQADIGCFEQVLETDDFLTRICPTPAEARFDRTSPDQFELWLFENGGDMRYFLLYLTTNCRLLDRSIEKNGGTPLFDVVAQVINRV